MFQRRARRDGDTPERSRRDARQPVPRLAATSKDSPIATSSRRQCRRPTPAPDRTSRPHRLSAVEDRGSDRSRLHGAAVITRNNGEKDFQFTEEARVSSKGAPLYYSNRVSMKWQAGVLPSRRLRAGRRQQLLAVRACAVREFFPSPSIRRNRPSDDRGLESTVRPPGPRKNLDIVAARARARKQKSGAGTRSSRGDRPAVALNRKRASPDVSRSSRHLSRRPGATVYGTPTRFKAGGFNAASPAGAKRTTRNTAGKLRSGVKTSGMNGRLTAAVAAFHNRWTTCR